MKKLKFLIDEDLPRSTGELIRRYGHQTVDGRDIGLRGSKDAEVASYARSHDLCLITGDYDFADIRNYPPSMYPGIIVIHPQRNATAPEILRIVEALFKRQELLSNLAGKLAVVEPGRVRVRR